MDMLRDIINGSNTFCLNFLGGEMVYAFSDYFNF